MHQAFVTMALTGLGIAGIILTSLCRSQVYAQHCRVTFMVLLKFWQINVNLLRPVWHEIKSPTVPRHCGTMLRSKDGPAIPSPTRAMVTNDWCIIRVWPVSSLTAKVPRRKRLVKKNKCKLLENITHFFSILSLTDIICNFEVPCIP